MRWRSNVIARSRRLSRRLPSVSGRPWTLFCLLLSFAGECILGHASSSPQHVTSPGAPSHSDPEFNDDSFFHNGSFMQTHREALGRRVSEHLVFVTEEESAVQSVEEVVYCTIYLTASLPLGLIGEIGFLLNRAVSLTLEIRSSWVKTADMLSSPAPEVPEGDTTGQDWQNFQFDFVVLPPQRGSAGVTYLLQVASEGSLLQTFKALVRESPSMKNVLISPFWVLLLPVPQVQEETVTRPTIFATWTSTEQPPIYIPAITTSPIPVAPQMCSNTNAPCTCAGIEGCEWVTAAGGQTFCQEGRGMVPCSACNAQEHCAATSCAGLRAACSCAYSPLGCHWDESSVRCVVGSSPGTPCSACASQRHCNPPEIVSIIPASGTQLRVPTHNNILVNFNRAVVITEVGSVYFRCSGQQLPFFVPWDGIMPSASGTGITISISVLLNAKFVEVRNCNLHVGPGVVVDRSDVPFTGLQEGLYNFKLGDTIEPQLIRFEPVNGKSDVAPGAAVTFTFDEELVLMSGNRMVTLYELSDATSAVRGGAIAEFPMSSPSVAIALQAVKIELADLTKPGKEYSIDLPGDALSDTSGNIFPGLPSGVYTFRCMGIEIVENPLNDGSLQDFYPVFMAAGAVFVMGPVCLMLWRLSRLKKVKPLQKPSSISPQTLPPGSPKGLQEDQAFEDELDHSATFASTWSFGNRSEHSGHADETLDNSGRNWAQKVKSPQSPQAQWQGAFVKSSVARKGMAGAGAAAATLNRDRKSGPRYTPPSATGPTATPTGAEADAKSKFAKQRPSSSNNVGAASSAKPGTPFKEASGNQAGGGGNQSNQSKNKQAKSNATDFSGDTSEVKSKKQAIEKKLRDMMQSPLAERKTALRELMLQYHPDKSSDPHAKEVFQFINASRGWFLAET